MPKDLAVDLLKTGSSKSEKKELKGTESKTDNVLNNVNCWASDLICICLVCSVFQRRTAVVLRRDPRFLLPSSVLTVLTWHVHTLFPALLITWQPSVRESGRMAEAPIETFHGCLLATRSLVGMGQHALLFVPESE